jgi:hypothetical protein
MRLGPDELLCVLFAELTEGGTEVKSISLRRREKAASSAPFTIVLLTIAL